MPIYSLYPLLEVITAVAEAKQRTRLCFHHSNSESTWPALVGFTASSYLHHPATQHSCLVADTAERGAYSPSTVAGHRLASLLKLLGAAKIWPHAFFLPPLLEGSKPWQRSSSDCQQQYRWCPFLSSQPFCTCLGQWKNLALALQICTVTRWYTVVVTWIILAALSKSVNFCNGL